MSELCIIITDELPKNYEGAFRGCSVSRLGSPGKISIEDYCFKQGQKERFSDDQFVIRVPSVGERVEGNHPLISLSEFALALLAFDGHPKLSHASVFKEGVCTDCHRLPSSLASLATPRFAPKMTKNAPAQWLHRCLLAQKKNRERIEIAAHRFNRFSRFTDPADAFFDLCIALESLLNCQTEVSFRFSLSLVKVLGLRGQDARETADLLARLYDLRSKLAHGAPSSHKLLSKMQADLSAIRNAARKILVAYVLFLGDHTRQQWDEHVNRSIYV